MPDVGLRGKFVIMEGDFNINTKCASRGKNRALMVHMVESHRNFVYVVLLIVIKHWYQHFREKETKLV